MGTYGKASAAVLAFASTPAGHYSGHVRACDQKQPLRACLLARPENLLLDKDLVKHMQ